MQACDRQILTDRAGVERKTFSLQLREDFEVKQTDGAFGAIVLRVRMAIALQAVGRHLDRAKRTFGDASAGDAYGDYSGRCHRNRMREV